MTNRSEYRDRTLDYRQEAEEHDLRHPEDADATWSRQNHDVERFTEDLAQVSERAAADFDRGRNPEDHSPEERVESIQAMIYSMNSGEYSSASDKRELADKVAHQVFEPLRDQVEMAEAASQHLDAEEFLSDIREDRRELAQHYHDGSALEKHDRDHDAAARLVEESRGMGHLPEVSRLERHRDRFADALYESQFEEKAPEMMETEWNNAVAYYQGDLSRIEDGEWEAEKDYWDLGGMSREEWEKETRELLEMLDAYEPAWVESRRMEREPEMRENYAWNDTGIRTGQSSSLDSPRSRVRNF